MIVTLSGNVKKISAYRDGDLAGGPSALRGVQFESQKDPMKCLVRF